jgi:hypothetical protein
MIPSLEHGRVGAEELTRKANGAGLGFDDVATPSALRFLTQLQARSRRADTAV